MKKFSRFFICIFVCLITLTLSALPALAASFEAPTRLDEIQDYTITVHMRPDGTMDIKYHVEWKVLNDSEEGPLTWVKIGNPNKHVDEITALSDNIKDISYMNDGGSYIRIDLDRSYYEDEIVIFEYTIHQSYMYVLEKENHICRYSFTPGWFEENEVKNITIKWSDSNVIESNAQSNEDGYLIWQSSLSVGEHLNASVKYNLDVFTTNENEQYTEDSGGTPAGVIIIIFVIAIVVIFGVAFFPAIIDDYSSHSGFGGGHRVYVSRSSCVRSSCACACACAGGGRAGCSTKDFYKINFRIEDIKNELNKKID